MKLSFSHFNSRCLRAAHTKPDRLWESEVKKSEVVVSEMRAHFSLAGGMGQRRRSEDGEIWKYHKFPLMSLAHCHSISSEGLWNVSHRHHTANHRRCLTVSSSEKERANNDDFHSDTFSSRRRQEKIDFPQMMMEKRRARAVICSVNVTLLLQKLQDMNDKYLSNLAAASDGCVWKLIKERASNTMNLHYDILLINWSLNMTETVSPQK